MTASARGTVAAPGSHVARKAGLNRAMLANAHGRFRTMLRYKCERSGAQLVEVPAAYTSQTCSRCQHCAPANRESQAVFRCQRCGLQLNADHNAALNIRQAALSASTGGLSVAAQGGPVADELRTPRRPTKRLRGIPVKAAHAA